MSFPSVTRNASLNLSQAIDAVTFLAIRSELGMAPLATVFTFQDYAMTFFEMPQDKRRQGNFWNRDGSVWATKNHRCLLFKPFTSGSGTYLSHRLEHSAQANTQQKDSLPIHPLAKSRLRDSPESEHPAATRFRRQGTCLNGQKLPLVRSGLAGITPTQ